MSSDEQKSCPCPCCRCLTLNERGMFECCPVCYWEDDGQDDFDADLVRGGPNESLSLSEARKNYRRYGACEKRFRGNVRPPYPNELPSNKSVLPRTSDEYGDEGRDPAAEDGLVAL